MVDQKCPSLRIRITQGCNDRLPACSRAPPELKMRFLHPAQLHWLWLALIPVALWLFRRKAKRLPVSTLLFFRSLAREHQESAWLRRLKKIISLLLSLLVLALATLALARPFREGGGA